MQAQQSGTLTGTVLDTRDQPLENIHIVISGTSLGAISDRSGFFHLERVPAGLQHIEASGVGYVTWTGEARIVPADTTEILIRLKTDILRLSPFEVTGTRPSVQEDFARQYTASKTSSELEGETARDFNSANTYDALRLVPGVSYLWGAGGRNGKPSRIRGASTWAIADVIEDFPSIREAGIGAEDGGLTADLGASIPAVSLEYLDVQKGSLGVLYSGDADGGVIVNRLDRGRPGPPKGTLWLEMNPIAEQLFMGDIGGGTDRFDYYLAAKALSGEYREVIDPFGRTMSDDEFYSGLGRFGYNLHPGMRIELFALRGRDQIHYSQPESDDGSTEVDESITLPPHAFRTTNTNNFLGLTLDHTIRTGIQYEIGYSLFNQKALRYSLTDGFAHRDRPETAHTLFGNLYMSHPISDALRYNARFGVEVVDHRQRELAMESDIDQRFRDHSVFYANALSFNRVVLNAGARYLYATDDFDNHHHLVYDAGISYRVPVIETKVRASYSTGYSRNKGFAYFFGPIDAAGGVALSKNRTMEAGVDYPFSIPALIRGTVNANVFHTSNDAVPVFSGWGAETVYYEEHEVDGIELSTILAFGNRVNLTGSFTYMDTEIVSTTHPDGVQVGNTGVQVPRYTAAVGAEWVPVNRLRLSLLGTYDDGSRSRIIDLQTGDVTITTNAAYTRLNAAVSYDITERFGTRLRIENIFDVEDLGYSQEVIGPDGYTFTETVARDPGRFLTLALTFNL